MTPRHRVMIMCADEVSADVRQRIEDALAALLVECTTSDANDDATDAGLVPLCIATPATEQFATPESARATCLLVSDETATAPKGWLALRADEIATPSRNWLATLEALGKALARPGLAAYVSAQGDAARLKEWADRHAGDPLEESMRADLTPENLSARITSLTDQLALAQQTALERDTARRAAEHDAQLSRKKAVAAQNAAQRMTLQNEALRLHLEESAWAPETLSGEKRQLVESARQAVWRARAAAAAAERAEEAGVDHRTWRDHNADYVGHTTDGRPHGVGVMRFGDEHDAPFYRGDFDNGARHGYGVGADPSGRIWIGEWAHNEPSGYGALELPGGARWEGRVAPASGDEPAYCNLHVWAPRGAGPDSQPIYTEKRLQLEAPPANAPPAN